MAGLNDLVTDVKTETTSLPSWYSQAQQQTVGKAMAAESPAIGQTAAQSAVNAFGAGSPFTAGQDILKNIGSGAANPWLVSTDATGAQTVTPNVNTALGGLFKSQQDYLNEIMPEIDAARTAGSIAGGDFGSRMNLSGIASARANAASDLFQKQMQSALQNQQTGVSAGAGLGNIGNQLVQSAINTGTYQQNAPYATPLNIANILGKINAPQTVTKSDQLGGLNQLIGLLSLTEGGLGSLLGSVKNIGGKPVSLPGILNQGRALADRLFKNQQQPNVSGVSLIDNPAQEGQEGFGWKYYSDGTVIDPYGQYYQDGKLIWSPFTEYFGTTNNTDFSGVNPGWLDEFDWDALAAGENPYDGEWNW